MPKGATSTIGTVSEPAGFPRLGVYITDVTAALSSSDAQVELQAVTKEQQAVTKEQQAVTKEQQAVTKEPHAVTKEPQAVTKERQAVTKEQQAVTKEPQAGSKAVTMRATNSYKHSVPAHFELHLHRYAKIHHELKERLSLPVPNPAKPCRISLATPLPGVSYNRREGAYAVIIKDGQLAVIRTSRGYYLPGGGLEDGESHVQCIEREMLEETGYSAVVGAYICTVVDYHYAEHLRQYMNPVGHFYFAKLGPKLAEPRERDHVLEWLPVDVARNRMYLEFQARGVREVLAQSGPTPPTP